MVEIGAAHCEAFLSVMKRGGEEPAACQCTAYHGADIGKAGEGARCRERLISEGRRDGFLFFEGGECVGWCQCAPWEALAVYRGKPAPVEGAWAITCMVVVPEARGRGLAHRMVKRVVEEVRGRGARGVVACGHRLGPGYSSPLPELPESVCLKAGMRLLKDDPECPLYGLEFGG